MVKKRLNRPDRTKDTETYDSKNWLVVASSQQGWRQSMEDDHVIHLDIGGDPTSNLFAVFDGHSGSGVSEYAANNFAAHLEMHLKSYDTLVATENVAAALRKTFKSLDAKIGEELQRPQAGSTACCVFTKDDQLYCANAGDSRAVACVDGRAVALSVDHKPNSRREKPRIQAAGGQVIRNRVEGQLAMSRALGDFDLKENEVLPVEKQMVTPVPDVVRQELSPLVEFVIVACDGIWDACTNEEAVQFVRSKIAAKYRPQQIVEELLDALVAKSKSDVDGSHDNMTCIIACHLNGRSYAELIEKCHQDMTV